MTHNHPVYLREDAGDQLLVYLMINQTYNSFVSREMFNSYSNSSYRRCHTGSLEINLFKCIFLCNVYASRKTWPRFQSSKRLICSASSASMGGSDSG